MIEELLEELISFRTVTSDREANRQALSWVEERLSGLPLHAARYESGGHPSLVLSTRETKTPKVLLAGHMDVVDGGNRLFQPKAEDGKLFGRGAYDMKFAIACYLDILLRIGSGLRDLDIALMLTSDEETGGRNGTEMLLDREGYGAGVVVLPDGGKDWNMNLGSKGVLHLRIVSTGVAAHASRPWLGENAIHELTDILSMLRAEFSGTDTDGRHLHETISVGVISGGSGTNLVAERVEACVDIRFMPDTDREGVRLRVDRIVSAFPRSSVSEIASGEAYRLDPENPYLRSYRDIASGTFGREIGATFSHGSSDARFFVAKGIPVIETWPRGGGAHADDEWVYLADLPRFGRVLETFVRKHARRDG